MDIQKLTDDAKAILLLCGRFQDRNTEEIAKPLTLREYNPLAEWLRDNSLRPADLLKGIGTSQLNKAPSVINSDRIMQLLSRGAIMALSIEKWINNGVWVTCRSDPHYPERLKHHLKKQAPPILYGVGDIDLLNNGGLAIVGSRNVDEKGLAFTRLAASESAQQGIQIVSGGARGVDQIAMMKALEAGGKVLGILGDSLLKSAVSKTYRDRIRFRQLTLISPYSPDARFNVGNAMGRNKLVYTMADFALIISAEVEKGGTWAGASEELRREAPRAVFVRDEGDAPKGNRALLELGASPFPAHPWGKDLISKMKTGMKPPKTNIARQLSMFDNDMEFQRPEINLNKDSVSFIGKTNIMGEDISEKPYSDTKKMPGDIYEAVLPVLLNSLKDWCTAKEIVENLDVRKVQLDIWLNRAVAEGKIEKKNRPVQYRRSI